MELIKDIYTVAELAKLLNIMPAAVRQQIRTGKLKADKFNNAYVITKAEAERYIESRGGKV